MGQVLTDELGGEAAGRAFAFDNLVHPLAAEGVRSLEGGSDVG